MGRKKPRDLMGMRFGRLVATGYAGLVAESKQVVSAWDCICDCGKLTRVVARSLISGKTTSCGCWARERPVQQFTTHNMSRSATYRIWWSMRQRCNNPNVKSYKYYGGRGIRVCERWNQFPNFLEDMGEKPPNLEIDRIDNDGNYEPANCRWTTRSEQVRNRRRLK